MPFAMSLKDNFQTYIIIINNIIYVFIYSFYKVKIMY